MILSTLLPLVSLVFFSIWMLSLSVRAWRNLARVRSDTAEVGQALEGVRFMRRGEDTDRWLNDVYAAIVQKSYSAGNPLIELINRIYAMREMAAPDLSSALGSVSERELERLDAPREVPNTLQLLGIMGTVVGLALALASFGLTDEAGGLNVTRTLSSLFLAFLTTILGFALAIALRGRLETISQEQSELLGDLETYAFTQLAPSLFPRNLQALQDSFFTLLEEQRETLRGSSEQTVGLLEGVTSALDQMHSLINKLESRASESAEAVSRANAGVSEDLAEIRAELSSGFLQELRDVSGELAKHRQGLRAVYEGSLKRTEEERRTSLQQAETLQFRYAESQKILEENSRQLISSMENVVTRLNSQSEAQTEALTSLRQEVSRLGDSLKTSQETYQRTFLERVQTMIREQFNDLAAKTVGLRRRG